MFILTIEIFYPFLTVASSNNSRNKSLQLFITFVHTGRSWIWHQRFIVTTLSIPTYYVWDYMDLNVFT